MLTRLILLTAWLAGPAAAADFAIHLHDGATWTVTAEHSRKVEGAHPQSWTLTTVKRLTWRQGKPATILVTPISATPGAGSPPELAQARSLAIPATVTVDEDLQPLGFVNLDEVRAEFRRIVPSAAGAPAELVDASALAMAATELGVTSRLQGLPVPSGKPTALEGEMELAPAGVSVKTHETIQLESSDPVRHRAVLVWRQTPDAASYRASLAAMLANMARDKIDPAKLAEAKAAWARINLSGENSCRDEIDTDTGLAVSVECSMVQTITDGAQVQRLSEHWTITQTSPEKS